MTSNSLSSMSVDKECTTDADGNEIGKLFIGGLSQSTNDASLRTYFTQFGEVEDAVVMMDNRTGRSRGFGYIKFKDVEKVNTVLTASHHVIDGKPVDAKQCNINMKGKNSRSLKIFVGGIAPEHDIDIVKNFFSQYGNVTEVNLMLDQSKQRHRGFAFVGFDDETVVKRLIQMHYLTMHGKTVEIKAMEPPNFVIKSSPSSAAPTITRFRPDSMVYPALPNPPAWPPMGYDSRSWMGQPPMPVPSWPPGHQWYGPPGTPCGYLDGGAGWAPPPAPQWGPGGWYSHPTMWPNGQPPPGGSAGWPSITQTSGPPQGGWMPPPPHHYPMGWDGNPHPSSVTVWSNSAANQRLDYDGESTREDSPSRISSPMHPYPNEEDETPPEGAHNYWLYGTKLVSESGAAPGESVLSYNHVAAGDFNRNNNKLVYNT